METYAFPPYFYDFFYYLFDFISMLFAGQQLNSLMFFELKDGS